MNLGTLLLVVLRSRGIVWVHDEHAETCVNTRNHVSTKATHGFGENITFLYCGTIMSMKQSEG